MKKLAIILDSFSTGDERNVTKFEDFYYLPLKVIVDGKEYIDGIDYPGEELLKIINNGKDVKTSQPSPAQIEDLFKKLSNEYENVIYFPIGTALSGTYQTSMIISKEYNNIHIIKNTLVGSAFFEITNKLMESKEKDIKELISFSKKWVENQQTFVIPKTIDAFIRGGRLNKTVAFILEKLKSVPIIGYDSHEKLSKKMVKRSGEKAYRWTIDKIEKSLEPGVEYVWNMQHTIDEEFAKKARDELISKGYEVKYDLTSSIICAHTGDGAFSLGVYKKIKDTI